MLRVRSRGRCRLRQPRKRKRKATHNVVRMQDEQLQNNAPDILPQILAMSPEAVNDAQEFVQVQNAHKVWSLVSPTSLLFLIINTVVFLACGKPFAGQGLLVALLHLNVASLQLERPGQSTAGPHPRKVFGGIDGEHIAQNLGKDG